MRLAPSFQHLHLHASSARVDAHRTDASFGGFQNTYFVSYLVRGISDLRDFLGSFDDGNVEKVVGKVYKH